MNYKLLREPLQLFNQIDLESGLRCCSPHISFCLQSSWAVVSSKNNVFMGQTSRFHNNGRHLSHPQGKILNESLPRKDLRPFQSLVDRPTLSGLIKVAAVNPVVKEASFSKSNFR